ncbi:MAG TPA: serine hydrolase domain-containing protein [Acidobacteriaceae bacterium]|jgi:CubicO group peptidase (beta-lactamase class C family)|nr:serine hydrolase domain-containing protein [Acidobacteriaceae bacterium]
MISPVSRALHQRFIYRTLLFLFAGAAYFAQCACLLGQTTQQIQQIGDFYHQRDGFSGEIVVAQRGRIVAENVYGYANQELKVPITPDTRFAIASVTKQFTAACILLLQEEGKLETADPIGLYLSAAPPAWKDVTIRDLLTHTSGITNDVLSGEPFTQFDHGVHTQQDLIDAVRGLPLKNAPGSKFEYNNLGYFLLGAIIEKVSGQTYAEFLRDHILGPLNMKDTGFGGPPEIISNRAFGYIPVDGKLLDADWLDPSVLGAAGAMYSTGADLTRWIDALENGRVLKPASLAEMNTPRLEDYGYGIFIEHQYGAEVIGHNGNLRGWYSQVEFYPHRNSEFVVLSNVSTAGDPKRSPGTYAVINELLELEADQNAITPSSGKEYLLGQAAMLSRTGIYSSDDSKQKIELTLKRGGLVMRIVGLSDESWPLKAESAGRFYNTVRDSELEFQGDTMIFYDYTAETRMIWHRQNSMPQGVPHVH